jgi:hypothetical protein
MYKIIGADGKEYGPIPVDTVRQWIAEGRANGLTQVQAAGSSDWRPLNQFPELAVLLSSPPPAPSGAVIPPMSPIGAMGTAPVVDAVNGPAIGLIVVGALGIIFSIGRVIMVAAGINPFSHMQNNPQWVTMAAGSAGIGMALVGILCGAVTVFGGLKMRSLQSYGLCMAASILAMIPCTSGCCLIGLPIGIWALVVLSKPEVKSAFH